MNTNFKVIGLTRLGIKPESTAQETDVLYHSAILTVIVHYSDHNSDFMVDVIGRCEGSWCCSTTCGKLSRCLPLSISSDGGSISKVGDLKPMTRFSSSTTKDGSGVARNFKGGHNFHIFPSVFFSAELIWSWLRNQWSSRGVWGHALPRNFWKLTCCNGYFSAFWIIFRQIVFKFFDLNCGCFAKYDAFCSHIFNYACLRRKAYCYRRGSKL